MSHHKQDLRAIFIYDNAMQANYDAQIPVRHKQKVVKTIRSNKYSLKAKLDFTFPIKVSANGSIHEHIASSRLFTYSLFVMLVLYGNCRDIITYFYGGGGGVDTDFVMYYSLFKTIRPYIRTRDQ